LKSRREQIADDRRLVLLARGGDREAFGVLVTKYTRVVRALVAPCLGWGHDADDAVQDVFLTAFRRLDRLSDPERFAGWLSRIAVNRGRGLVRRAKPRRTQPIDLAPEPVAATAGDPVEVADEAARVHRAMRDLDETSQAVLALRFAEELSVTEVAHRLGMQPPAVSMRITRALRALRAGLSPAGGDGR